MNLNEKDIFKQRFYSKIIFVLIITLRNILHYFRLSKWNGILLNSSWNFLANTKIYPYTKCPPIFSRNHKFCFADSFTRHNCHNDFSNICPISRNNRLKLNWNQHFYKDYNKSNRFIF